MFVELSVLLFWLISTKCLEILQSYLKKFFNFIVKFRFILCGIFSTFPYVQLSLYLLKDIYYNFFSILVSIELI